jgi:hydroxymethylpyrimidine pyrophosphatase-like HAD family hydrolase
MKTGPQIFCVDFDGTIVTHEYPEVGTPVNAALDVLHELQTAGHAIILLTMRGIDVKTGRNTLQESVEYLTGNGIKLYGVNENPHQHRWTTSKKVYGHWYIDDAAVGVPLIMPENQRPYVDWIGVRQLLWHRGILL